MTPSGVVTYGGLVIGLAIVLYQVIEWYPGLQPLKKKTRTHLVRLLPFLFGFSVGMLCVLSAGGIIGKFAHFTVWSLSWLGDAALIWGIGGERESVTAASQQALTNGGHAMTLLAVAVFLALMKKKEETRKRCKWGWLGGVMLGLVKSVAGAFAIPLASAMNAAGVWISTGVLQ